MSRYKGLFTFDEDNHRYVPIAQADGIIDTMDYEPDSKPAEPLIKDKGMREAVRAWAKCCGWESFIICNDHFNNCYLVGYKDNKSSKLEFNNTVAGANKSRRYTIAELCGEEE